MRHQHRAGDKLFIDYAGQTIPIYPRGAVSWRAELFVAVLGASNYTSPRPPPPSSLSAGSARTCAVSRVLGAVPALLVPDNLRCGVTRSHRYEPLLNRTYQEMAAHYGTAILPARTAARWRRSRAGVQIAERWILASLRNERFTASPRPTLPSLPGWPG